MKKRLAVVATLSLFIVTSCGERSDIESPGGELTVKNAALTEEQCEFFNQDGQVTICHDRTWKKENKKDKKSKYVIVRTSVEKCVNKHVGHQEDYIAVGDHDCDGDGCFPYASPYDGSVACCDGLTDSGGYCLDVDECAAETPACDVNADCANVGMGGGFSCTCKEGYEEVVTEYVDVDSDGHSESHSSEGEDYPYEDGSRIVCADIDECELGTDNCSTNGTCENTDGSFICICVPGYDGATCANDIDECADSPCLNGGSCNDLVNDYSCTCAAGYDGEHCETDIDECADSPCLNGGSCNDLVNDYSCTCAAGYEGDHCETDINECVDVTCLNGGSCNDLVNDYSCTCAAGYEGDHCETDIDECVDVTCLNGGSCNDLVNDYSCTCAAGYEGDHCETDINECVDVTCLNGGSCNDLVNDYSCTCAAGYEGDHCETDIDECVDVTCLNGGSCNDLVNDYSCTCAAGYEGDHCETDIDECVDVTCLNGGSCNDLVNDYSCTCAAGYEGDHCETDIDECVDVTCLNGGSCNDLVNDYSCTCAAGYEGDHCETDIDECVDVTCLNGGSCNDLVNDYSCTCAAGYEGDHCETDIDECVDVTCLNGGSCNDLVNDYSCTCAAGYEGDHCETDINECVDVTCLNGGSCNDLVNDYSCTCAAGYEGDHCETDIDECVDVTCLNGGSCNDLVNDYSCTCAAGYEGDHCETDIDECVDVTCLNGGSCNDLVNDYSCTCAAGYEGDHCETDIDECVDVTCLNGGNCNDLVNDYSCTCAAGYEGDHCETDINECADSPCQNGGSCNDLVNGYSCTCAAGYEGDHCDSCAQGYVDDGDGACVEYLCDPNPCGSCDPGAGQHVTLTTATTIDATNGTYDCAHLTIATAVTISGEHNFRSLTVVSGGSLSHPALDIGGVHLTIGGTFEVQAGGQVDVSGRGGRGGRQSGNTSNLGEVPVDGGFDPTTGSSRRGGGSHGGRGKTATGGSNAVYGDPRDPREPGSGGGAYTSYGGARGGNGGGLVQIAATDMVLDGQILANGSGNVYQGGGGSGGGIRLELTGALSGAGTVQATGSGGTNGANGGGGRIAVTGFSTSTFGGTAQAGTVFMLSANDDQGVFWVDGSQASLTIELGETPDVIHIADGADLTSNIPLTWPALDVDGSLTMNAPLTVTGALTMSTGTSTFHDTVTAGSWTQTGGAATLHDVLDTVTFVLSGGSVTFDTTPAIGDWTQSGGTTTIPAGVTFDPTTFELFGGAFTNYGTSTWPTFDSVSVSDATVNNYGDLLITDDTLVEISEGVTVRLYGDLRGAGRSASTVGALMIGGVVEQTAQDRDGIHFDALGSFELASTGIVRVNGAGGRGGRQSGNTSNLGEVPVDGGFDPTAGSSRRGGGSHGGRGKTATGGSNAVYGDPRDPREPGSGGGAYTSYGGARGGNGGGLVQIAATDMVLDGQILANGSGNVYQGGGGSGGGIRLELSGALSGAGTVQASGSGGTSGANGGGGRIAVTGFSTSTFGGTAQAGTVFMLSANDDQGVFWVDGSQASLTIQAGETPDVIHVADGADLTSNIPLTWPALDVDGSLTMNAPLTVTGALTMSTGTSTFHDTVTAGSWTQTGGAATLHGVLDTVTFNLSGGSVTFETTPAIGDWTQSGGTATIPAGVAFDPTTFELFGGTFTNYGTSTWPTFDSVSVSDATVNNYGDLLITDDTLVEISEGVTVRLYGDLRGAGRSASTVGALMIGGVVEQTAQDRDGIHFDALGSFELASTGIVRVNGAGGRGGRQSGNTSNLGEVPVDGGFDPTAGSSRRGGGSHGGRGKTATGGSNAVYGDPRDPREPGSGGGAYTSYGGARGGNGGGLVQIAATDMVLDGQILANGSGNVYQGGGGSGGGIRLELTGALSGAGTVQASGSGGTSGANGGGGRIAVTGFSTSTFGGTAQAGTVFMLSANDDQGVFWVDGSQASLTIEVGETPNLIHIADGADLTSNIPLTWPALDLGGSLTMNAPLTVTGALTMSTGTSTFYDTVTAGSWTQTGGAATLHDVLDTVTFVLSGGSVTFETTPAIGDWTQSGGTATIPAGVAFDPTTFELSGGTFTNQGTSTWPTFDSASVSNATVNNYGDLLITDDTLVEISGGVTVRLYGDLRGASRSASTVGALTIGGVVEQTAQDRDGIHFDVLGPFDLTSTGIVRVNGAGGRGGRQSGNTSNLGEVPVDGGFDPTAGSSRRGGGSHGGRGKTATGGSNAVYGDPRDPREPGSGGGAYTSYGGARGGNGGGLVQIAATDMVLDGQILANGSGNVYQGGGGSGGGIRLELTGALSGAGTVQASGSGGTNGANGGGGRIAVTGFSTSTFGGTAQAGTVFMLSASSDQGVFWADGAQASLTIQAGETPDIIHVADGAELTSDIPLTWPALDVDGSLTMNAPLTVTGALTMSTGTSTFHDTVTAGSWNQTGGAATLHGVLDTATFVLSGGSVTFETTPTIGDWTQSGGTATIPAGVAFDPTTFELSGGTFTNQGTSTWPTFDSASVSNATVNNYGDLLITDDTLVEIAEGVTVRLHGDLRGASRPAATVGALTIGGVVEQTAQAREGIHFDALGPFELTSTGIVRVNGTGGRGGRQSGNPSNLGEVPVDEGFDPTTGSSSQGGGSYGTLGSTSNPGGVNPVYGDPYDPREPGSGGGAYTSYGGARGGNGGGLVQIAATDMILDGQILANGTGNVYRGGGGSGGGIRLELTGDLAGTGTLQAIGSGGYGGANGGGGRIAITGGATGFFGGTATAGTTYIDGVLQ